MRLHQPVPVERQPHLHQGGIPTGYDDGGMVAETGTVDPNAYLRWPNQVGTAGSGFEDGGQVDPNAFLDPMSGGNNMQALADHASQVYQDYHRQLEQEWSQANQSRGPENFGDTSDTPDQSFARGGKVKRTNDAKGDDNKYNTGDPDRYNTGDPDRYNTGDPDRYNTGDPDRYNTGDGYATGGEIAPNNEGTGDEGPPQPPGAMGGGIPPGPGPAGAGVTPKPAKSPQQAIDRNFYQDQSSRQFTSPSVGTSFTQPGPLGGQRGQEWYGKGRGNGRR